jgi:hypothetical protein
MGQGPGVVLLHTMVECHAEVGEGIFGRRGDKVDDGFHIVVLFFFLVRSKVGEIFEPGCECFGLDDGHLECFWKDGMDVVAVFQSF